MMKHLLIVFLCLWGQLATASASGFEYEKMVLGFHFNEFHIGIANFKHITTGEVQGKILFEPLATITLPVSGDRAFSISCLLLVLVGVMTRLMAKSFKRIKSVA